MKFGYTILFSLLVIPHICCRRAGQRTRAWKSIDDPQVMSEFHRWFDQAYPGANKSNSTTLPNAIPLVGNGKKAMAKQFPSTAYIVIKETEDMYTFCSGVLVGPKVVLTAAHCVTNDNEELISPSKLRLKVGIEHYNDGVTYRVRRIVTPRFRPDTSFGDVAVLQLSVASDLPAKPSPLSSSPTNPEPGSVLTTFGWGETEAMRFPTKLYYVNMTVPSKSRCSALRKQFKMQGFQKRDHLCIGKGTKGKSTCDGDSGSPFINDKGEVVALTSYGPDVGCGSTSNFDMATSIAYWRKWIQKRIQKYNMND